MLRAGDPAGHVATTWQAKELIRSLYDHVNETLALEFIIQLGKDFTAAAPPEVRSLGRTLLKWKHPMVAWHQAHVKNGPTEAIIIWSRLWFPVLSQLPDLSTSLRRQTQLVTTSDHHTPLKSEEPDQARRLRVPEPGQLRKAHNVAQRSHHGRVTISGRGPRLSAKDPIEGKCAPSQDSLDLIWVTPDAATSPEFEQEMVGGQGRLVRMALAHCGLLP